MALKLKLDISVSHIKADDHYYSFDFVYRINNSPRLKEHYSNDYSNGMSREEWIAKLKDGEAIYLALQAVASSDDI